ncbi:hypothetical protein F5Y07DRAFT_407751 [Xylaria sp. FL0933]|nr:hypothetical protein F5Y07DRAFT_407751 [Xylaria sp. FL0933]
MATEAQLEHTEETTGDTLPPYPIRSNERQLRPAMSGWWYWEHPQPMTIQFRYCPNPFQEWRAQDWVAMLCVKCGDVPRLMREGFHWDSENVINEDRFITPDNRLFWQNGNQWNCMRHYYLADLHEPPRWIANIEVLALREETLCRFDLDRLLLRERIQWGLANSQFGHAIYRYCHGEPQYCFNVVYNGMPMEGHWPWPRNRYDHLKG